MHTNFNDLDNILVCSQFSGYLPPPIKPTQLAQRLLQQQKYERLADESGDVEEIEMEVEEQDSDQVELGSGIESNKVRDDTVNNTLLP